MCHLRGYPVLRLTPTPSLLQETPADKEGRGPDPVPLSLYVASAPTSARPVHLPVGRDTGIVLGPEGGVDAARGPVRWSRDVLDAPDEVTGTRVSIVRIGRHPVDPPTRYRTGGRYSRTHVRPVPGEIVRHQVLCYAPEGDPVLWVPKVLTDPTQ